MTIDNLGGGEGEEPSSRVLREAMLQDAGWPLDTDLEAEGKTNELFRVLGDEKLRRLMKDKGGLSDKLISSELDAIKERLRKVEEKVRWYLAVAVWYEPPGSSPPLVTSNGLFR